MVSVTVDRGETQPPKYLTESELIGTMEKNGIGTGTLPFQHTSTPSRRVNIAKLLREMAEESYQPN